MFRICRDRQVRSALRAAAVSTLKANVITGRAKGPKWSDYEPNDIHLEAVRGAIARPFRFAGAVWCATLLSIFQAHMRHRSAIRFQVIARSPSPRKPIPAEPMV